MLDKLNEWRKAIVGVLGVLIPALNSMGVNLPAFLTTDWLNTLLLALTPVLVYFVPNKPNGNAPTAATARSPWQIGILALLMGLLLSGCGIANPFKYAETPEQRYVAVSGTYEIVLETANEIVQNEATPLEVVQAIDDVQKRTTGVMDALDEAFVDYMVAKAELETGETSQERLDILSANLGQYLDQAMRAYRDLASAVD